MIEVSNIIKDYPMGKDHVRVLKDISFTITKGEFVAIMGPSGSGKSTLMHILGALDTPSSGTYKLDGQEISALDAIDLARIRKEKIGFVFQAFHLLPRATVIRNVALPLIYSGVIREEREKQAKKALLSAGLEEDKHLNLSNQLSGGQMQRVAIARALVTDPSILLADEPTGNLDTKTGDIVMGVFKQCHDEGRTIVIITHEPEVAQYADRILTIRDGELVDDCINKAKRIPQV